MYFQIDVQQTISDEFFPTHIEKTECYDRYGNEIIGVICEKEVVDNPYDWMFDFIICIPFTVIMFALWVTFKSEDDRVEAMKRRLM